MRARASPTVAVWALVATVAGVALRALEQLPFPSAAWPARVAEWIGSVAWSLASFFVVPVLALEDVGVGAALRRSVQRDPRRSGASPSPARS